MASKASSSTRSACRSQSSHNSSTVSWMKPSPKLRCGWRRSITGAPPGWFGVDGIGPQSLLIEFADLLQGVFPSVKVLQVAAHLGDLFLLQAEVTDHALGVADGQDPNGVALA